MLDLNLRISSNHKQDEDCKVPISMFLQQQSNHSSSSSSSDSFITFDKSGSYLRMVPTTFEPTLTFGILKKDEKDVIFPPLPLPRPRPCVERRDKSDEWLNLWWKERSKEEKVVKKSRRGPRSRSSNYRGVTFYRRTGRWESHIWDSGKQVYLGGFDTAYAAARAYDRAAIKFRGIQADINFVVDDYNQDIEKMNNLSKEEFVQSLRKESASLARSGSKYKGLTLSKCTQLKNHDQIHQFNNRAWNEETIKCNEKGKRNEDIKLGLHNKGNLHNELELSLGISSSDINGNAKNLYSKQLLPKMVAASSGFPFISVINSSSFHP